MSWRSPLIFIMSSMLVSTSHIAGAALHGDSSFDHFSNFQNLTPSRSSKRHLQEDQWYKLGKTVSLPIFEENNGLANFNVQQTSRLTLVSGTEFNVLEVSNDGRVLIAVDEDISQDNPNVNPNEPTIAWVSIGDLLRGRIKLIDERMMQALDTQSVDQNAADQYVETEVAARRGGRARRRGGRRGRGGMTFCLRDVRIAAARFTRKVPQNIPRAALAYPKYKAAGWVPVQYSPSNPIGTACFFGGGRRDCKGGPCGHAAIKIRANAWKGAGVRPTPFLPNRRGKVYSFHGCLVPPGA